MAGSHGEGATPAAWTMVAILIIASIVGGIAVVIGNWWLFGIGGGGLMVVGMIVGKAMSTGARAKETGEPNEHASASDDRHRESSTASA